MMNTVSFKNGKLKRLVVVLSISILLNIFVLLPYTALYWNKICDKILPLKSVRYFTNDYSNEEILDKVCKATVLLDEVKMPMDEPRGLVNDLKTFYLPSRHSNTPNNYYTAYGMVGASYYAMSQRDSSTMNKLKYKVDGIINREVKKSRL